MQYIALIYKDETIPVDMEPMMQAYGAFNQELVAAGHFVAGDALQPVNKIGGISVTVLWRLEFIRALGRIASQCHHMTHAGVPIAPGGVIDFAAAVADAG